MSGIEELLGAAAGGGSAAGTSAAGTAGGASVSAFSPTTASLSGLGLEMPSVQALGYGAGMTPYPALGGGPSGVIPGAEAAQIGMGMTPAVTKPADMMNMSSPKGGGGGYGGAMKDLMGGNTGQTAMDLMKIAASRPSSGGTIPSLGPRQSSGGTQPSVQQFLQLLAARRKGV